MMKSAAQIYYPDFKREEHLNGGVPSCFLKNPVFCVHCKKEFAFDQIGEHIETCYQKALLENNATRTHSLKEHALQIGDLEEGMCNVSEQEFFASMVEREAEGRLADRDKSAKLSHCKGTLRRTELEGHGEIGHEGGTKIPNQDSETFQAAPTPEHHFLEPAKEHSEVGEVLCGIMTNIKELREENAWMGELKGDTMKGVHYLNEGSKQTNQFLQWSLQEFKGRTFLMKDKNSSQTRSFENFRKDDENPPNETALLNGKNTLKEVFGKCEQILELEEEIKNETNALRTAISENKSNNQHLSEVHDKLSKMLLELNLEVHGVKQNTILLGGALEGLKKAIIDLDKGRLANEGQIIRLLKDCELMKEEIMLHKYSHERLTFENRKMKEDFEKVKNAKKTLNEKLKDQELFNSKIKARVDKIEKNFSNYVKGQKELGTIEVCPSNQKGKGEPLILDVGVQVWVENKEVEDLKMLMAEQIFKSDELGLHGITVIWSPIDLEQTMDFQKIGVMFINSMEFECRLRQEDDNGDKGVALALQRVSPRQIGHILTVDRAMWCILDPTSRHVLSYQIKDATEHLEGSTGQPYIGFGFAFVPKEDLLRFKERSILGVLHSVFLLYKTPE